MRPNKLRIKLISPPLLEALRGDNLKQTLYFNYYLIPSYGMGIITATLRHNGYHVFQQDLIVKNRELRHKYSFYLYDYWDYIPRIIKTGHGSRKIDAMTEEVLGSIELEGFDAVGFSVLSFGHFITALMLAKRIRSLYRIPVIFGGSFMTLYADLYPEILNYVDYIIVGDGREPLLQLLERLRRGNKDITGIPNMIYKKDGRTAATGFATYPLESVPAPDFTGLALDSYRNPLNGELVLPYEITRGCMHKCNFCVRSPMKQGFEAKSYDKVIRELKDIKAEYGTNKVMLCDLDVSWDYGYFIGLLEQFIRENIDIVWRSQISVRSMSPAILNNIRRAGCDGLMYGIETGSERILKSIDKGQTMQQAEQALAWTKRAGIKVTAFFMTGYPYEQEQDTMDTVDFISKNRDCIDFGVVRKFTVVARSFIHQQPSRYGIRNLKPQKSRYMFGFDETRGLSWRKKTLQQEGIKRRIEDTLRENVYA